MTFRSRITVMVLALVAAGCVAPPQRPVPFNRSAITQGSEKLGIAIAPLPKVDTTFPGAGCLLCLAAAAGANSALTKHATTLPYEGLDKLPETIAARLRKQGIEAQVISEPIAINKLGAFGGKTADAAKKNFQPLRDKYHVDRILIVDLQGIGFIRTYSSYFPTSDPKALVSGSAYIVNLSNNVYDWYLPLNTQKSAEGAWDEPPQFPGLTNAYFQAIEITKDQILDAFK